MFNVQYPMFNVREGGAVALLLTVIILLVIFVIAIGIAAVRLIEMKLAFNVSESMIAYQAADSGIEDALYGIDRPDGDPTGGTIIFAAPSRICDSRVSLIPGWPQYGKYCLELICVSNPCDGISGNNVTEIKSIGSSPKTRRAIRVKF